MWIPGYRRIDLGPDGGPFDETVHPKGCVHTTEGSSIAGAEAAYRDYPPHIGYDPIRRIKHQYISLNRYSYAFKGSESDDEYIIQIEVVGFASQTHNWSDQIYRNFAEDVIKPLEELVGIPRNYLRFYGADEGIVLARANSPIRLNSTGLRNYSGWLGHQHIPKPDTHWDPGRFRIDKSFAYLEDDMSAAEVWNYPISFTPPGGKTVTFSAAQFLVWSNYYAGLIEKLFKIIADNEANDLTEAKLRELHAEEMVRIEELLKNAAIDVDVTVGGEAVD